MDCPCCTPVDFYFPMKHPTYRNYKERLKTFEDWPKFLPGPSKEDLARSGFFYTGKGDRVYCFCCGVCLKDWVFGDSAYQEHAQWSPFCHFVTLVGI